MKLIRGFINSHPDARDSAATILRTFAILTLAAGCVPEGPATIEGAPPAPHEVATWTFAAPSAAATIASLWPAGEGAPTRGRRQMSTSRAGSSLVATPSGADPYFLWKFEQPIQASAVTIIVDAGKAGVLQLFWSSAHCPTFRETCSLTRHLRSGANRVDFLVDFNVPLRELRLDLPGEKGERFTFESIQLLGVAEFGTLWEPRAGHTTLRADPAGMLLTAIETDPWATIDTPGLEARWVDTVEVVMSAATGTRAFLFWRGEACANFSADCAVALSPSDGGRTAQTARLAGLERWEGRVDGLRLDPSEQPGSFVIERLSLLRDLTAGSPAP